MSRTAASRAAIAPFYVMEVMKAAGERERAGGDVLHLEVGQPSTPAPKAVLDAAADALRTDPLRYTDALGTMALLAAAMSAGAVAGGVFSGWLPRVRRQGLAVVGAIVAWGLAMTGFGLAAGAANGSVLPTADTDPGASDSRTSRPPSATRAVSACATSISAPRPLDSRAMRAASTATAATCPPMWSGYTVEPSLRPVSESEYRHSAETPQAARTRGP